MSPVIATGAATFTLASDPDLTHGGLSYLHVEEAAAAALVYIPLPFLPLSSTVTGATLTLRRKGSGAISSTVQCQLADGPWSPSGATWNTSPTGTGPTVSVAVASSDDGDEITVNVAAILAAALTAGTWSNGLILTVTAGDPIDFYSFASTLPPSLTLTWSTVPAAPTNLRPSGGRAVGTNKPTLRFDAADVRYLQVQITATTDTTWTSLLYDSGTQAASVGEWDLSKTAYGGLVAATVRKWRARYKNSSGDDWSPWTESTMQYKAYLGIVFTVPDALAGNIVPTDTPTITWNVPFGTQTGFRLTVAFDDDHSKILFDSGWVTSSVKTCTIPEGVILDSSILFAHLEVADGQDREAVPGFPLNATLETTFTFQGVASVVPPDSLAVSQVGTSPFNLLTFTRGVGKPDGWHIRRDGLLIAGQAQTADLEPDDDGFYHWIDFTASGGFLHHYKIDAKVGGVVSSGGPTQDFLSFPTAISIGDEGDQSSVEILDTQPGDWTFGEVGATYYPVRGSNAIRVTQTQRGYEGSIAGLLINTDEPDGGAGYNVLMKYRANPSKQFVLGFPQLAFRATLDITNVAPTPESQPFQWAVNIDFLEQGDILWRGRDPVEQEPKLLLTVDFEEGTDGAAITTTTQPYAHATSGAPKYEADAAQHGVMGMRIPAAAGGGWVSYPCTYIGSASIYFIPRTSSDGGALIRMDPFVGVGNCFFINLRGGGDLDISDGSDALAAKSHGVYGWTANRKARCDLQWVWDPVALTCHVVARLFTSPEAVNPSDEWDATFGCTLAPGFLAVGNGTSVKETDYDTIRIYSGNGWPEPLIPGAEPETAWSIPGLVSATGFTVSSRVANVDTIQLAVSTSLDADGNPASPLYYDPDGDPEGQLITPEGLVTHSPDGYDADTVLYAKLSDAPGSFLGDLIQVRTKPVANAGFTRKIVLASCQGNARVSQTQLAWTDMLAFGPDDLLMIGDFHYLGGSLTPADPWQAHLDVYTQQMLGLPAMKQMLARAGTTVLEDDHAFSADNGDSNESTDTGKVRAVNILALQNIFPNFQYGDTRAPEKKRGLYGTAMVGNHVRLVFLDAESLDRSIGLDDDTPSKTFLGLEQDAWLRTVLVQPAAVNILICPKAPLGDSEVDKSSQDKIWAYTSWRTALASWISSAETVDGKDVKVYFWGGDRHFNAYKARDTDPVFTDAPILVSSGTEQHALDLHTGEDYDDEYGAGDHTLNIPVVQYVQVTITDAPSVGGDGSGTVTIDVLSREVHDTLTTDPADYVMVDGFSESDSWDYTAQPGQLLAPWAGDATQTTVEISALTADAWNVGLLVSANADMSAAATYPSAAPDEVGWNKWSVADLSPGRQFYYQFTDTLPDTTVVPISDVFSFWTLADVGVDCEVGVAVGSCKHTAPANTYVWDDMLAWDKLRRVMHLGDWGYPGYLDTTTLSHRINWANNAVDPGQVQVAKVACLDYIISDHDDNGSHRYWPGGNGDTLDDPVTKASIEAWAAVVPARMDDTRDLPPTGNRARYRSEVEGRVRFVKLDTRSLERSSVRENGVLPDDPTTTMLGATQLAWLQSEIKAAADAGQLVALFTDPAWNGVVPVGYKGADGIAITFSDKWPAYSHERDIHISDYAASVGAQLFVMFGDSHLIEQDDGTNERNGFASICCGPFDQTMHAHFQDSYEFNYPHGIEEGGHHYPYAQMYQRVLFTTEGNKVTVVAQVRDCTGGIVVVPDEVVNGHQYGTMTKVYNFGGSDELAAQNPGDQTSTVGDDVALQLTASGGTQPYAWGATGLPSGTSISADGLITGTLTTAETDTVVATVTDADSNTSQVSFGWTVDATPPGELTLNNPGDQAGTVGDVVGLQLSATGGVPPYTYAGTSGLPKGLTQRIRGKIAGTLKKAGDNTVTPTVTDSVGSTASTTFGWHVDDQVVYQPPDGSITPEITSGETFRQSTGGNTHWNFAPGSGGGYQV